MLSYAICVHDEHEEISRLLTFLQNNKYSGCSDTEIVILQDGDNPLVTETLSKFSNINIIHRTLNGDFAAHKNFLSSKCRGEYIFNIDADEMPTEAIIDAVLKITESKQYDLVYLPRINICIGYTENFIKQHKFQVNEVGWINWPDFQGRIYKNGLHWGGAVHEKIQGAVHVGNLDPTVPTNALLHIKTVQRQCAQNALYAKLEEKK